MHSMPDRMTPQPCLLQCLGPFAFFDVKGTEGSTDDGTSYLNTLEAELVMEIFLAFVERYPNLKGRSSSIAIISPYKGQVGSGLSDILLLLLSPFTRFFFL